MSELVSSSLQSSSEPLQSFYNVIGSPKLVVAPMVDQSELAYRMLTRKYGAQLVFTQMFNANSFVTSKGNKSFDTKH